MFTSDHGPRLLTDFAVFAKMREMIVRSNKRMTIVSPYIDPPGDFIRQLVEAAEVRKVDVSVWFRKDKVSGYLSQGWLRALEEGGVALGCVDRLHSKIYANEKEILVTSMNFLSTSGENSFEAGICFEVGHPLAAQVERYLASLKRHVVPVSKGMKVDAPVRAKRRGAWRPEEDLEEDEEEGFCIRCGGEIELNPDDPYCGACFEEWDEYGNPEYRDDFCHGCGRSHPATMNRPLCPGCFRDLAG